LTVSVIVYTYLW